MSTSSPLSKGKIHERIVRGESTTKLLKFFKKGSSVDTTDELGRGALHLAAQEGRIDLIRGLLSKGANINCQDNNGWTPLHSAASNQQFKACSVLLESRDIDPTTTNNEGTSALHYLVRAVPTEEILAFETVLHQFTRRGADLNIQNKYGEAPLHSACMKGNEIAVRFILEKQADSNIMTNIGETPLHYAVYSNKMEIVKELCSHGADPRVRSENGTPCDAAAKFNFMQIFELLTLRASELGDSPLPSSVLAAQAAAAPASTSTSTSSPTIAEQPQQGTPETARRVAFGDSDTPEGHTTTDSDAEQGVSSLTPLYQDGSLKKGYLEYLQRRRWLRYWCVLKEDVFVYYESPEDSEPVGQIDLDLVIRTKLGDESKLKRENCFELAIANDHHQFAAEDEMDRDEWMELFSSLSRPIPQSNEAEQSTTFERGSESNSENSTLRSTTLPRLNLTAAVPASPGGAPLLTAHQRKRLEACQQISWLISELNQDMPLEESIVRLLTTERVQFTSALGCLDSGIVETEDYLALGLFMFCRADGTTFDLLQETIYEEISKNDSETLFRATSVAIRVTSIYLLSEGSSILSLPGFVNDVVRHVNAIPHSLEVNPETLPEGGDAANNVTLLCTIASKFLNALVSSVEAFPAPWRTLFAFIMSETEARFPGMGRAVVGNFLFLRFFCPAIVSPIKYKVITAEQLKKTSLRGLILLTKLLQNLVNGVEFDGSKERYMTTLNPFILQNKELIATFFDRLIDPADIQRCSANKPYEPAAIDPIPVKLQAMIYLLKFLNSHQQRISSMLRFLQSPSPR